MKMFIRIPEPHTAWRCALMLYAASLLGAAGGCALTSKNPPLTPRYFSPERQAEAARPELRLAGRPLELRLGHIDAASYLEERLVFRSSDNEISYYPERRWTESPERYLRRRLARVLFEEYGLRQVIGGSGMTLDVQLTAFEEIREPQRIARIQAIVRLHDQRLVRWAETLTLDQPVAPASREKSADPIVEALGQALRTVVDRISMRVVAELTAQAPYPTAAISAGRNSAQSATMP